VIDILCDIAESLSRYNVGAGKIILESKKQVYETRFGNHVSSANMDSLRLLCAQEVYSILNMMKLDEFKATIEFEEYSGIYSFSMRKNKN
jgi:hypothetical protein